jgi:hypothetical protein
MRRIITHEHSLPSARPLRSARDWTANSADAEHFPQRFAQSVGRALCPIESRWQITRPHTSAHTRARARFLLTDRDGRVADDVPRSRRRVPSPPRYVRAYRRQTCPPHRPTRWGRWVATQSAMASGCRPVGIRDLRKFPTISVVLLALSSICCIAAPRRSSVPADHPETTPRVLLKPR